MTFGGAADDLAMGVAVDAAGNIFVVGATVVTRLPVVAAWTSPAGQPGGGPMRLSCALIPTVRSPKRYASAARPMTPQLAWPSIRTAVLIVAGATRSADLPVTDGAFQSRFGDIRCSPETRMRRRVRRETVPRQSCGCSGPPILAAAAPKYPKALPSMRQAMSTSPAGRAHAICHATTPYSTECLTAYTGGDCGDAFIMKLANSGSSLLFGSFIGRLRMGNRNRRRRFHRPASSMCPAPPRRQTCSADSSRRPGCTTPMAFSSCSIGRMTCSTSVSSITAAMSGWKVSRRGSHGILYLIGAADVAVPSGTPCCYSDRDAYVTTIR